MKEKEEIINKTDDVLNCLLYIIRLLEIIDRKGGVFDEIKTPVSYKYR